MMSWKRLLGTVVLGCTFNWSSDHFLEWGECRSYCLYQKTFGPTKPSSASSIWLKYHLSLSLSFLSSFLPNPFNLTNAPHSSRPLLSSPKLPSRPQPLFYPTEEKRKWTTPRKDNSTMKPSNKARMAAQGPATSKTLIVCFISSFPFPLFRFFAFLFLPLRHSVSILPLPSPQIHKIPLQSHYTKRL